MSDKKSVPGQKPGAGDQDISSVNEETTRQNGGRACTPCDRGGSKVMAYGFCLDCREFLCSECFKQHKNIGMLRSHKLLMMNEMPKVLPKDLEDRALTDVCQRHINEFIKFYCKDHDEVVCGVCRQVKHSPCKVEYIPDVANKYTAPEDIRKTMETLEALGKRSKTVDNQASQNLKTVDKVHGMTIDQLNKFRAEMIAYLDTRERELLAKADDIKGRDEARMVDIRDKTKMLGTDIEKHRSRIKDRQQSPYKLFTSAKQAKSELKLFGERLDALEVQNVVEKYEFKPHPEMQNVITRSRSIGEIVVNPAICKGSKGYRKPISLKQSEKVQKIYKSYQDKRSQCISSIAVINDNLLAIADLDHTIKILRLGDNKTTCTRTLDCQPWDVARVSEDTIAVSLPAKRKISFLSVEERLSDLDFIDVSGMCLGLEILDGNFFVSFNDPPKVEVMDRRGSVVRVIDKDSTGKPLFSNPTYLTVANMRGGNNILVSDDNCIFQLSTAGILLSKLSFEKVASPMGIAPISDGVVAICNQRSDTIHLVADDGWDLATVDTLKCDMFPRVIAVNQRLGAVYVSFNNGKLMQQNYIRVYKIDH